MKTEAESDREVQVQLYRAMLRTRPMDERAWMLQRHSRVAFYVSCIGHEDNLTSGYRAEIAAIIAAKS